MSNLEKKKIIVNSTAGGIGKNKKKKIKEAGEKKKH